MVPRQGQPTSTTLKSPSIMGALNLLASLMTLAPLAVAGGSHNIPEVQSMASSMIAKYSDYVHYTGPATQVVHAPSHHIAMVEASAQPTNSAVCSYWMAEMANNGVAAFNTQQDYSVFRNVMDYGAKGMISFSCPRLAHAKKANR